MVEQYVELYHWVYHLIQLRLFEKNPILHFPRSQSPYL